LIFHRLAVLGDPVEHSLSPAIHRAGLAAAGLRGTYTARCVSEHGMAAAVDDMRTGRLTGANVTMPHKRLAAGLSDTLSPEARAAGAVNTLVRNDDGSVAGHNTDVAGIRLAWEWAGLPGGPVLILGAGGAAAASLLALSGRQITISARRRDAASELTESVAVPAEIVAWGTVVAGAVVVNATPVGMHGEAFPDDLVEAASGWFEMAYGSGPTPATQRARARGVPVATGPDMLLGQAIGAFELWTGVAAPTRAMRQAMTTERRRRGHDSFG
jgi:shikimate dehydrogenase